MVFVCDCNTSPANPFNLLQVEAYLTPEKLSTFLTDIGNRITQVKSTDYDLTLVKDVLHEIDNISKSLGMDDAQKTKKNQGPHQWRNIQGDPWRKN